VPGGSGAAGRGLSLKIDALDLAGDVSISVQYQLLAADGIRGLIWVLVDIAV
jgi:hypothetical protein